MYFFNVSNNYSKQISNMNYKKLVPKDFQGLDFEKKVYAAIIKLNGGNTKNLTQPSYKEIKEIINLSTSSITKGIKKLKNDGIITNSNTSKNISNKKIKKDIIQTTSNSLDDNKLNEKNTSKNISNITNSNTSKNISNNLLERLNKCAVVMKDVLVRLAKLEEENENLKSQVTELSNKVLLLDAKLNAPKKLGDELVELWNGCERENTLIDSYERLKDLVNGNDLSEKQKVSSLKVLEKYKDKYQNLKWEIDATNCFNELKKNEFSKADELCRKYLEGETTDEENDYLNELYYVLQEIKVHFKFSRQQMNEILRIEELLYKTLFD